MAKLELKAKAKLVVNIGGTDYELTRPKVGAVMQLENDVESAKTGGGGVTEAVKDFIVRCGLPENVVMDLDSEDLLAISDFLVPSKKN